MNALALAHPMLPRGGYVSRPTTPRPPVMPAHLVPPGAVVLSLSGTEREDLTNTVVIYGIGLVAVGLVTGYILWGR